MKNILNIIIRFITGAVKGAAVESNGLTGIIGFVKSLDKKKAKAMLDVNGDGKIDWNDLDAARAKIRDLRWEELGKVAGIIAIYFILLKLGFINI